MTEPQSDSNWAVLCSIAPGMREKVPVSDDDLLSLIGGILKDRRRWAGITRRMEEEQAVGEWLERHPLVTDWLQKHGWTISDADEANELWMKRQSAVFDHCVKHAEVPLSLGYSPVIEIYRTLPDAMDLLNGRATLNDLPAAPATAGPEADDGKPRHSPDFHSVNWYGARYEFTTNQAACVRVLWNAWRNGTPAVHQSHVTEEAGVSSDRLDKVFRRRQAKKWVRHPAWKTMIVRGRTSGTFQLNDSA